MSLCSVDIVSKSNNDLRHVYVSISNCHNMFKPFSFSDVHLFFCLLQMTLYFQIHIDIVLIILLLLFQL